MFNRKENVNTLCLDYIKQKEQLKTNFLTKLGRIVDKARKSLDDIKAAKEVLEIEEQQTTEDLNAALKLTNDIVKDTI